MSSTTATAARQRQQQQRPFAARAHASSSMFYPWDAGHLGLQGHISSQDKHEVQQASAHRLVHCLEPSELPGCTTGTDKVFCCTWLDHDNVLFGTKCNRLRQLHCPTRTWHELPYPAQPVHRLGPDLLASAHQARAHCGQHALAVSPSGAYLVSGGTAAEDILLWRLQQQQPEQRGLGLGGACSSSGSSSSMQLQPVQTAMGHADWVFGLDFLSDRHWVSGSRDGTIKLWQVPDAAAQPAGYSAEPLSALLSVAYHEGKVRAVQFDQQQQHLVALSTDNTISWWTPDLQLKGSAQLDVLEPVALKTCGDLAIVGAAGSVLLLDTREPNAGHLKRSHSSHSSSISSTPSTKRSRTPHSWAAGGTHQQQHQQQQEADAPAASGVPGFHPRWLPQAYARPPALGWRTRPVLLALTGPLQGLQQLQTASAVAGMDPLLAEHVLRQESARMCVAQGRSFDAALQGLVSSMLRLSPAQQLQELAALQRKHSCSTEQQQEQEERQPAQQQQQQEFVRQHSLQPAPARRPWQQQLRQREQEREQQQQQQLQHQQLQIQAAAAAAAAAGAGHGRGEAAAGAATMAHDLWQEYNSEDGPGSSTAESDGDSSDADADVDEDGGGDSDGGGEGFLWQLATAPQRAAALDRPDLPNSVRYFLERQAPRAQYAMNGDTQSALQLQLRQQQQLSAWPMAHQQPHAASQQLQARIAGLVEQQQAFVVRSLSLINGHVLGVGHTGIDFFDMRRMQGRHIVNLASLWGPDSSLLLRRLRFDPPRHLAVDPELLQHGYGYRCRIETGLFTHAWDPSGTRLLVGGGALALGGKGGFLQLWT